MPTSNRRSTSTRQRARKSAESLGDSIEAMRETATGYVEAGRERAMELEHTLEERIQDRPLAAVLTSAGIGFLVGYLVSKCTLRV